MEEPKTETIPHEMSYAKSRHGLDLTEAPQLKTEQADTAESASLDRAVDHLESATQIGTECHSQSQPPYGESTLTKDMRQVIPASSAHLLQQNGQQLIEDINAKRKQDTQLMCDFKRALDVHVQKTCTLIEQSLFQMYDQQSKVIQDKLQELFAALDRIAKLESELQEFKQALCLLYQDMHQTQ